MSSAEITVVHYVNQFFGGLGREDKADVPLSIQEGPVGPGLALQKMLGDRGRIAATLMCGDNYFAEDTARACEEGIALLAQIRPQLVLAGPAGDWIRVPQVLVQAAQRAVGGRRTLRRVRARARSERTRRPPW